MYSDYLEYLKKRAGPDNRRIRRASTVSLVIPAKKGMFLDDIIEIADILLVDKDDVVRKGCGWMMHAINYLLTDHGSHRTSSCVYQSNL